MSWHGVISARFASLRQRSDGFVHFLQDEIHQMDLRLLNELDEKVIAQQSTLQSAGVPGFFVTTDPKVYHHVLCDAVVETPKLSLVSVTIRKESATRVRDVF